MKETRVYQEFHTGFVMK